MQVLDRVLWATTLSFMMTGAPGCAPPRSAGEAEERAARAVQGAGAPQPDAPAPASAVPIASERTVGPTAQPPIAAGDVAHHESPPRPEITPTAVITELERIRAENSLPQRSTWAHDAGATVAGDPKLASRIAALLLEPTSTYLVRSVGISLLRTDGSEHGQAAIRGVLSDPGVQADSMYPILILGLLDMPRPSEETVALLRSLRSSEQVRVRDSATTVLGTQIWALSVTGRVPLADSLAAELTDALKASRDPSEQANVIEALARGNRPQTRATVRSFARSKDPLLRAATAKGLASDEGPEAVSLLLKLLVDPAPEVQSVALDSLHWRTLSAAQQATVHAAIMSGALRPKDDVLLALFVERHLGAAARNEALAALLARNAGDERVQAKLRELLASG